MNFDYVEPELPKRFSLILETEQYEDLDETNWDEISVTETRGHGDFYEEWKLYSVIDSNQEKQLVLTGERCNGEVQEIAVFLWACFENDKPILIYGDHTEHPGQGAMHFDVNERNKVHQLFDECVKFHAQVFFFQKDPLREPRIEPENQLRRSKMFFSDSLIRDNVIPILELASDVGSEEIIRNCVCYDLFF